MVSTTGHILPLLFVATLWFASTALVVWLDNRPTVSFASSLTITGMAALFGVGIIATAAASATLVATYASFVAAFAVWGWHELSFLTGTTTGPRRTPCPADASGWKRFRLSAATVIHHELALAATLALLLVLTSGSANPTGAYAFAILFGMRLSTKLNVFLGVPNFSTDILPPQLAYLKSYFRTRAFNALMPVSLALGIAASIWLGQTALASVGDAAVMWSLLTGLALLGVVEHLFLVLPLRDSALWRWAMPAAPANEL
jgi:putative photosynthetic complex assembly protein 2